MRKSKHLLLIPIGLLAIVLAIAVILQAGAPDTDPPLPPQKWHEMGKYGYVIDTVETFVLDAKTGQVVEHYEYQLTLWAFKRGDPALTPIFSYFDHSYDTKAEAAEHGDNWMARVKAWIAVNKKEAAANKK